MSKKRIMSGKRVVASIELLGYGNLVDNPRLFRALNFQAKELTSKAISQLGFEIKPGQSIYMVFKAYAYDPGSDDDPLANGSEMMP